MEEYIQKPRTHIAILSSLGMGHLISLIQFSKRLLDFQPNFLITLIIPTDGSPLATQKPFLESLPKNINTIFLPPPPPLALNSNHIPENAEIVVQIHDNMMRSLPAVRDTLRLLNQSNSHPVSILVVDLFGPPAIDLAREFNISPYMFFSTNGMFLSLVLHMPKIDKMFTCDFRDSFEPIKLPGIIPLYGKDLVDSAQDRKSEAYKILLQTFDEYKALDGIFVNSFMGLESSAFRALKEIEGFKVPIYPIGPITQYDKKTEINRPDCLKWLDEQPFGSTLFVSFGSGGTLSQEQLNELAFGLELSGQRFLWVIRTPNEKIRNAAFFSVQTTKRYPLEFLPKGFLERTKGKGLVIPSWAPQNEVLNHGSIGGFLTHCGWNSVLESMVNGIPLIAWPLYAEQKMNSVLLTDDLKVAFRVNMNEDGIVEREEIAKLGKKLIEGEEGEELRKKMKYFKDSAAEALTENGSSFKSLVEVASKWINC